ncbi:hypothetical protein [Nonomuraea sp. NPDC002799]
MPTSDSQCRWCAEVFFGVESGKKAPEHDNPSTGNRCAGTGQKTGAYVG